MKKFSSLVCTAITIMHPVTLCAVFMRTQTFPWKLSQLAPIVAWTSVNNHLRRVFCDSSRSRGDWLKMVALKIPTVRNFFCYFELTTGGLILGWFDAIVYGLTLLLLILNLLTGRKIFSTEELNHFTVLGKRETCAMFIKINQFICRTRVWCCGSVGCAFPLFHDFGFFHPRYKRGDKN